MEAAGIGADSCSPFYFDDFYDRLNINLLVTYLYV